MNIRTTKEIMLEVLTDSVDAVALQFRGACRPIYGWGVDPHPVHLGSCILLEVDSHEYIVTAAHLLDNHKDAHLSLSANMRIADLTGNFIQTTAPNGNRDADKFDFAFKKLTQVDKEAIGDVTYIRKTSFNLIAPKGRLYMAYGYPNSKNKPDKMRQQLTPCAYPFAQFADATDDHFYLDYDLKKIADETGKKVNGIKIKGLSGGALIDLGQVADPSKLGSPPTGILCGMIIELKDNKIIAVKIGTIINAIKERSASGDW